MSTPSASVIVRARDEADAIGRTLARLRERTLDCKIVVVDSASTDGTPKMARRGADDLAKTPPKDFP